MVARYTHLAGRDINNAVLKANGIDINEYGESLQPKLSVKICQKCREKNEMTAKYCARCGTSLEKPIQQAMEASTTKAELDTIKEAIVLLMAKLDPETRDKLVELVKN